jgi:hypothetical protein
MTAPTGTSRRALLGGTALGLMSGLLSAPLAGLRPAFAGGLGRRNLYSRARFTPFFRQRFRLVDGRSSWTVTLVRISDLRYAGKGDNRSFALTFRSRTAGPPQGTYVLRRRGFAPTTLFIVPDAAHRSYQATVFGKPHA